jgi:hypothetical protein
MADGFAWARRSRAARLVVVVLLAALAPTSLAGAQRTGDARVAASGATSSPFAVARRGGWADTTPRPRYSPADAFTARLTLGAIGMALGSLGGFAVARAICEPRDSDGETCDHVPTAALTLSGAAIGSTLGVATGAHGSGGRRSWGMTLGGAAVAAALAAAYAASGDDSGEDPRPLVAFIFGTPATVIGAMVGNYAGQ